MSVLGRLIYYLKLVPVYMGLAVFYLYGALWSLKPRRVKSMRDVLDIFYYNFLFLKPQHVEVIKLNNNELVTISRNPCPILKLTLLLKLDTKYTCRVISETVCKYVLRKLDPNLVFERDYNYIRPYKDGCLERIWRKRASNVSQS